MKHRHIRPDGDDALGWLGLLFFTILAAMAFAMCQASTLPQGFAP